MEKKGPSFSLPPFLSYSTPFLRAPSPPFLNDSSLDLLRPFPFLPSASSLPPLLPPHPPIRIPRIPSAANKGENECDVSEISAAEGIIRLNGIGRGGGEKTNLTIPLF